MKEDNELNLIKYYLNDLNTSSQNLCNINYYNSVSKCRNEKNMKNVKNKNSLLDCLQTKTDIQEQFKSIDFESNTTNTTSDSNISDSLSDVEKKKTIDKILLNKKKINTTTHPPPTTTTNNNNCSNNLSTSKKNIIFSFNKKSDEKKSCSKKDANNTCNDTYNNLLNQNNNLFNKLKKELKKKKKYINKRKKKIKKKKKYINKSGNTPMCYEEYDSSYSSTGSSKLTGGGRLTSSDSLINSDLKTNIVKKKKKILKLNKNNNPNEQYHFFAKQNAEKKKKKYISKKENTQSNFFDSSTSSDIFQEKYNTHDDCELSKNETNRFTTLLCNKDKSTLYNMNNSIVTNSNNNNNNNNKDDIQKLCIVDLKNKKKVKEKMNSLTCKREKELFNYLVVKANDEIENISIKLEQKYTKELMNKILNLKKKYEQTIKKLLDNKAYMSVQYESIKKQNKKKNDKINELEKSQNILLNQIEKLKNDYQQLIHDISVHEEMLKNKNNKKILKLNYQLDMSNKEIEEHKQKIIDLSDDLSKRHKNNCNIQNMLDDFKIQVIQYKIDKKEIEDKLKTLQNQNSDV
ncbi:conserved protein, unknown function [Hepatocystis sp. ex Piliocolobus tephrosceles]|nr:conserved protein, unknown function [Hepatocystis sp. ex Piliocolobus tephrosceles]